ncbi:hypothetical protein ACWD4N_40575, partial [Streptomyces sp. NPDC002586]
MCRATDASGPPVRPPVRPPTCPSARQVSQPASAEGADLVLPVALRQSRQRRFPHSSHGVGFTPGVESIST